MSFLLSVVFFDLLIYVRGDLKVGKEGWAMWTEIWDNVLQRSRTERVESDAFPRVDNGQFPRHGQHCAFTGRVCELGRRAANQRNYTRRVDDAGFLLPEFPHTQYGMLTPKPDLSMNPESALACSGKPDANRMN